MDLTDTARPRKLLLNRSFFIILALATAPILLAWAWAIGPGFGNNREVMILVLPFMIVLTTCFGLDTLTKHPFGLSLMIAPVVSMLLMAALAFTPSFHRTLVSAQVKRQMVLAERNIGQPPAIGATVTSMLDDPQQVATHLELLQEIRASNTKPDSVTAYVATAESFGVDASFVRNNGLVRKRDVQAVIERAQELAKGGNLRAARWLKIHNSDG